MADQDVEQTYDALAATYDLDHAARRGSEITAVEEVVVMSLLRRLAFRDVLDAGTGTGRYGLRLAGQGKQVVAIDQSAGMLAVAQGKAAEDHLPIVFRKESICHLSAPDASFDLVLCMLTLAHVQDLYVPLREFLRVLRPGGHLVTSDMNPGTQAAAGRECTITIQGRQFSFPQYHTSVDEYVDAAAVAGAEVLAAIDVPMEQTRGLFVGPFVLLARKPYGNSG